MLGKLQEFGLTVNMTKCQWAMAECTYFGHVVGGGQVQPEINKLEAVEKFPVSKTKEKSGHSWDYLDVRDALLEILPP